MKKVAKPRKGEFTHTTRYDAIGGIPDRETACRGECEAMGVVPIRKGGPGWLKYRSAWLAAEKKKPSDDGYHFLKCLTCGGTGKKPKK